MKLQGNFMPTSLNRPSSNGLLQCFLHPKRRKLVILYLMSVPLCDNRQAVVPYPPYVWIIDTLGDALNFTILYDFNLSCNIKITTEDRRKTFFVCHSGQFQYICICFCLNDAPATFQRVGNAFVILKMKKRSLFSNSVEYLVHTIHPSSL